MWWLFSVLECLSFAPLSSSCNPPCTSLCECVAQYLGSLLQWLCSCILHCRRRACGEWWGRRQIYSKCHCWWAGEHHLHCLLHGMCIGFVYDTLWMTLRSTSELHGIYKRSTRGWNLWLWCFHFIIHCILCMATALTHLLMVHSEYCWVCPDISLSALYRMGTDFLYLHVCVYMCVHMFECMCAYQNSNIHALETTNIWPWSTTFIRHL